MTEQGYDDDSIQVFSRTAQTTEEEREPQHGVAAPVEHQARVAKWGRYHDVGLASNRNAVKGTTRRPYHYTEEQTRAWSNPRAGHPPPAPQQGATIGYLAPGRNYSGTGTEADWSSASRNWWERR